MGHRWILSLPRCITWLEIPRPPVIAPIRQHKHYQNTTPSQLQHWNKNHKLPSYSLLQQWSTQSNPWKHPHGRSLPAKDIHSSFGEGCFSNTSLYKRPQIFPIYTEIWASVGFWRVTLSTTGGGKVANRFVEAVSRAFPDLMASLLEKGVSAPILCCILHNSL